LLVDFFQVGADVKVKVPDGQDMVGVLVKITDSSSYTVVFDDGDERTLKRTSLCIKGEKHFNESETLDHLPLTDPENFGTPVMQVYFYYYFNVIQILFQCSTNYSCCGSGG
jgi:hypothetical protein